VVEWLEFVVRIVKCKSYQDVFLNGLWHLFFYDHDARFVKIKSLLHCMWYLVYEWVMIDWCMCTITRHGKRCGYFGCNTWMIKWFIGESYSLIVNGVLFGFGWSKLHVGYGVWDSNSHHIFWWNSAINDGLYPNLSLCYGIGAHMNSLIVQQNIILFCATLKHHCNCSKRIKKYYF